MEDSNSTGKMIGALLLGAVIGGALGILFAPDKGSNTRKKISSKGDELSDAIKEKFNHFIDNAKDEFQNVKEKGSAAFDNGMAKAEKMNKDV